MQGDIQKKIAKDLLRIHGDKAYMLVLMEMEDNSVYKNEMWREILNFMEQLEKEQKNASN